jgi:electron transfer flavoprotein alpha/beta subunit
MQLIDLLSKPINELTTDELEARLNALKSLKVMTVREPKEKKKAIKSNASKQITDLLGKLSEEDLKKLLNSL